MDVSGARPRAQILFPPSDSSKMPTAAPPKLKPLATKRKTQLKPKKVKPATKTKKTAAGEKAPAKRKAAAATGKTRTARPRYTGAGIVSGPKCSGRLCAACSCSQGGKY